MDKHDVRFAFLEDIPHARQDPGRNVIQILPSFHDVQVIIRLDIKYVQDLIQHLPMLPCHANNCVKLLWMPLEFLHQRTHLNCLRTRPED